MDKGLTNKSLVAVLLLLGLAVEQPGQVHADVHCPNAGAWFAFESCISIGGASAWQRCAKLAGCDLDYYSPAAGTGESDVAANLVLKFCKSGCTSSVCSNVVKTAAVVGDKEEAANKDVVDRCGEACSRLCTKHHVATVATY